MHRVRRAQAAGAIDNRWLNVLTLQTTLLKDNVAPFGASLGKAMVHRVLAAMAFPSPSGSALRHRKPGQRAHGEMTRVLVQETAD